VQHDIIEWSRHLETYSVGTYTFGSGGLQEVGTQGGADSISRSSSGWKDTTRTVQVYTEVQNILTRIEVQAQART